MSRLRVVRLVSVMDVTAGEDWTPETGGNLAFKPYPCEEQARGAPGGVEELGPAADRVLWVAAEVFAGRRPFQQLAALATAELAGALARQAARTNAPGRDRLPLRPGAPRIRGRRIQEPRDGVAEITATVVIGGRIQPIALRLVLLRGRWKCAALETVIPS